LQKRLVEVLGPQVGSGIATALGTTVSRNSSVEDEEDDAPPVRTQVRQAAPVQTSEPDDEDLAFLREIE